jgi:DNA-directed RNA polymerase subunit RPC12/RpoP
MPFQISCTSCGQPIQVMEHQAGQVTACPTCGAQAMVPPPPGGQYAAPQGGGYAPLQGGGYAPPPSAQQYAPPGGGYGQQPPAGGYQFNASGFAPQGSPVVGGGIGSRIGRGLGGLVGLILVLVILNVLSYVFNCGWVFY